MAHPSGSGAFQTFNVADDGSFTWQSHPTFKEVAQAKHLLDLLNDLSELSAEVIQQTVRQFETQHDSHEAASARPVDC
jgi:hypothetical protein